MKPSTVSLHNPDSTVSLPESLTEQRLLDVLGQRRSRRFAKGMSLAGPLEFKSQARIEPLTEAELATLSFAACGITGHALGELPYTPGGGGTMMATNTQIHITSRSESRIINDRQMNASVRSPRPAV